MATNETYDVVIIGAGWYGLIAATTYLRLAPETKILIVDKGHSIGGVWSEESIYPNLFVKSVMDCSSILSILCRLKVFLRIDHDLVRRVRLGTEVSSIENMASGSWRLDIAGDKPIWASKLIIATGVASEPYSPKWPNQGFTKPIIHSADIGVSLKKLHDPAVKRVVVLGAAKSSYDTVFLLLKAGKHVD
ncbi:Hypothetical protein PENO1_079380 [Penicillium occitanis (nom. inval.)]|nr:Hypothetical protein PENO1_079380 [Penicillium occitanis (nom. inval.)]PCG94593.1 hypothetical protein PENOC_082040 [Penicillium occitanis (nom. inval.)]